MDDPVLRMMQQGIVEALHPSSGCRCQYRIDDEELQQVKRKGAGRAKELFFVAPQVLLAPTAIYRGLAHRGDDWLCYCGLPAYAYDYHSGRKMPPHSGEIYLVFVNGEGFVYQWRWETADPLDPTLPRTEFSDGRFTKRLR